MHRNVPLRVPFPFNGVTVLEHVGQDHFRVYIDVINLLFDGGGG